jgi:hypothetical protein
MKTWNVLVPVVGLIGAETREEAIGILQDRIKMADLDSYDEGIDAFESEEAAP